MRVNVKRDDTEGIRKYKATEWYYPKGVLVGWEIGGRLRPKMK